MSVRFDQPEWLWLLLALPLLAAASLLRLRGDEWIRIGTIVTIRVLLLTTLVLALARPAVVRESDELAVVALVDVSGSVRRFGEPPAFDRSAGTNASDRSDDADDAPDDVEVSTPSAPSTLAALRNWLRAATESRRPDDRLGLVLFDGRSAVASPPRRGEALDDEFDRTIEEGTDIAGAIRLGMALFPADANRRLLLVSDGNETSGDAFAAAREAAAATRGGVQIDVLPVAYRAGPDVQVVRLEAPPTARPGQVVTLRVVLEATAPMRGRLSLTREGELVDLDPGSAASDRLVEVPEGVSVQTISVTLDDRPITRFAADFVAEGASRDSAVDGDTPVDGSLARGDAIAENDRAEAVITNPGAGAVLLIRGDAAEGADDGPLAALLRAARRPVLVGPPSIVPRDLLELQAFDLVILEDVAASQLDPPVQSMLADAVDRLGAGLIMGGGPHSFGAGGWKGTPVARVLPISLELPKQLRAPRAALVLVLDKSGSMAFPVAGTGITQQRVANEAAAMAIESLAARSYVGVIAFDHDAEVVVPIAPNDDPAAIADAIRGIRSQGGTNIAAGLAAAQRMFQSLPGEPPIEEKRLVFLTDGRSQIGPTERLVEELAAADISITTIAVGDDADDDLLRRIAQRGNGVFHAVRNPRTLPRVLVDSVQVVNRPLVRETPFLAQALPTGSRFATLLRGAPELGGVVLTSPREDSTAVIEWTTPEGEPLLAHWVAGLGRVVAFTSEIEGPWAGAWLEWPGWAPFWSDVVRLASRPSGGAGLALSTRLEEGRLLVELEVDAGSEQNPADAPELVAPQLDPAQLSADATIYRPNGRPSTVPLRRSGPRTFVAEVDAEATGGYVVAVTPRLGDQPLAPLVAGATRPGGAEFRRFRSNIALLREIAELTGGRVLDPAAPDAEDLFDRAGLPPVRSERPLWPWCLWAAAVLLVLDVASRRIAWSPRRLRDTARSVILANPQRRAQGSAAVEQLRRVGPARPERGPPVVATVPVLPPHDEASAGESPEAQAVNSTAAMAALDAMRGRGDVEAARRDESRTSSNEPARPPAEGSGSSAASLLDAKRRARDRMDR